MVDILALSTTESSELAETTGNRLLMLVERNWHLSHPWFTDPYTNLVHCCLISSSLFLA